jgi:hypothetical protein
VLPFYLVEGSEQHGNEVTLRIHRPGPLIGPCAGATCPSDFSSAATFTVQGGCITDVRLPQEAS